MRNILTSRWHECSACIRADAPLSATVMMGGLLESIVLARINQLADKGPVFKAAAAPKDRLGKSLVLQDWTLRHYIDVAHELNWITQTAKDLGEVLRDYRNYIHPYKQKAHRIIFQTSDAAILWKICQSIVAQLLLP